MVGDDEVPVQECCGPISVWRVTHSPGAEELHVRPGDRGGGRDWDLLSRNLVSRRPPDNAAHASSCGIIALVLFGTSPPPAIGAARTTLAASMRPECSRRPSSWAEMHHAACSADTIRLGHHYRNAHGIVGATSCKGIAKGMGLWGSRFATSCCDNSNKSFPQKTAGLPCQSGAKCPVQDAITGKIAIRQIDSCNRGPILRLSPPPGLT